MFCYNLCSVIVLIFTARLWKLPFNAFRVCYLGLTLSYRINVGIHQFLVFIYSRLFKFKLKTGSYEIKLETQLLKSNLCFYNPIPLQVFCDTAFNEYRKVAFSRMYIFLISTIKTSFLSAPYISGSVTVITINSRSINANGSQQNRLVCRQVTCGVSLKAIFFTTHRRSAVCKYESFGTSNDT